MALDLYRENRGRKTRQNRPRPGQDKTGDQKMTFRIATKEESAEFWKNRPKSLGDGSIISIPLSCKRKAPKGDSEETKPQKKTG